MEAEQTIVRHRLTVTGVVQGVGFRPFVYGLAHKLALNGFVGNDSSGVFIELEGTAAQLAQFQTTLRDEAPPLAHIETTTTTEIPTTGTTDFTIVHSQTQASANTLISPDICICADCLAEIYDPNNRRYGYPFTNCTNCGPRYTIIKDIPYDRPLTTMADFPMCPACQAEYDNPLDRRFHAQPNACAECGPHVWLESSEQLTVNSEQWPRDQKTSQFTNAQSEPTISQLIIKKTQALLAEGKTIAIKGLGGFHLACDATNEAALNSLRERKGRVDKPFAVMALEITAVRQFAHLSPAEETLLTSKERPILLLRKKADSPLSDLVAPGNNFVGVMLPYTPLHYLLLSVNSKQFTVNSDPPLATSHSSLLALVMTSANYANEPIVKDNDEARAQLATLADAFLFHNRAIHARADDSVVRILDFGLTIDDLPRDQSSIVNPKSLIPIRRSRGYAPFPVKLPQNLPCTLAVGGELKATFCLTKDNHAFMSAHIGDMENLETLQAFETAVSHFQSIFRAQPERIVCDMHPGYLSTQWAERQAEKLAIPLTKVQHHHAHIAAVMAEHQLDGSQPVIGFSFDGTGYGTDGAIWGSEVMLADYQGFERIGHLKYVPLVGGDAAVKRPFRVALAHLWAAGIEWSDDLPCLQGITAVERNIIRKQLETGLNSVPTSSMGRLFDAVAALAGIRQTVTYEAQAAIEFESLVDPEVTDSYHFKISYTEIHGEGIENHREKREKNLRNLRNLRINPFQIDPTPLFIELVTDVQKGTETAIIAAKFHNAVADLILQLSHNLREQTGINQVALSGGVFQSVTLLEKAITRLHAANFEILTHQLVPPNDGGLALGQAMVTVNSD